MRTLTLTLLCSAAITASGTTAMAEDIVIGVPNWPSVQATAHILKLTLEERLELGVELQDASNEAIFRAMDTGSIHVHPEAWLPNLDHLKRRYVDGTQSIRMSPNGATGKQAMCVTKGTAERTGITDLKQLSDPDMAANFDLDGDGTGDIWIGAEGWGSTPIEQVRARSYGYDETMDLYIMEELEALQQVAAADENDQNAVFFCYTPHHMFQTHDLVVLNEPAHDARSWVIVPPSPTPGWLEKSMAGVAWDTAQLYVSYATALETDQPKAAALLSRVVLSTEDLSRMAYALEVENQDPAAFAKVWVEENADMIDSWLE
ncbi:amino acid-binding protein [Thalassococcus sp. S3]|nr:amino acid-binding protein [Thalassococcus sp. S3]